MKIKYLFQWMVWNILKNISRFIVKQLSVNTPKIINELRTNIPGQKYEIMKF